MALMNELEGAALFAAGLSVGVLISKIKFTSIAFSIEAKIFKSKWTLTKEPK